MERTPADWQHLEVLAAALGKTVAQLEIDGRAYTEQTPCQAPRAVDYRDLVALETARLARRQIARAWPYDYVRPPLSGRWAQRQSTTRRKRARRYGDEARRAAAPVR
jgi:hypothetical protein